MALQISYDQRSTHERSKEAMKAIKGVRAWNTPADAWMAPSFPVAPSKAEEPIIPAPEIFQLLSDGSPSDDTTLLPSVAQCAVHLELLQALYTLRRKVLQSVDLDATCDIVPKPRMVWQGSRRNRKQVKVKDTTFAERRKEKWPVFIKCAVYRFLEWLKTVDASLGMEGASSRQLGTLPPLDVLMVWHSFLLNPKHFQMTCKLKGLHNIRNVDFPWMKIHEAIDSTDWSFTLQPEDALQFTDAITSTDWSSTLPSEEAIKVKTASKPEADLLSYLSTSGSKPFLKSCLSAAVRQHQVRDIVAAVERQASFVDKMEQQLWIRSPAVAGTLQRAVDRYSKFLRLLKLYPGTMFVPTLDIDLAWHTHQCSAARYERNTLTSAGRFIDHDDKLGALVLDSGLEKTVRLFRVRFGLEYLVCTCWDCQAVLSEVEKAGGSESSSRAYGDAISETVARDVAFHRAVEIARRAHKPLPMRNPGLVSVGATER